MAEREDLQAFCFWAGKVLSSEPTPKDLTSGEVFARIMHTAAPSLFPLDEYVRSDVNDGDDEDSSNWIRKRANLKQLATAINSLCKTFLSSEANDLFEDVDTAAIARDCSEEHMWLFGSRVFAASVLASSIDNMKVKQLNSAQQGFLHKVTKTLMSEHKLAKAKKGAIAEHAANNAGRADQHPGSRSGAPTPEAADSASHHQDPGVVSSRFGSRHMEAELRFLTEERNDLAGQVEHWKRDSETKSLELDRVREERTKLEARNRKLVEEASDTPAAKVLEMTKELEHKTRELREAQRALERAHSDLDTKSDELRTCQDQRNELAGQLDAAKMERDQFSQKYADASENLQNAQDKLEAISRKQESVAEDALSAHGERKAAEQRYDALAQQLQDQKNATLAEKSKTDKARARIAELETQLTGLEVQGSHTGSAELQKENLRLRTENENERKTNLRLESEIEQLEAKLSAALASSPALPVAAEVHAQQQNSELVLEAERQQNEELRLKNARLVAQISHLEQSLEQQKHALQQQQQQQSAAVAEPSPDPARIAELEGKLAETKKALHTGMDRVRGQHAALVSAVFEAGQRNLQLQYELLALNGGSSIRHTFDRASDMFELAAKAPRDRLAPADAVSSSFVERQRRSFASGALQQMELNLRSRNDAASSGSASFHRR